MQTRYRASGNPECTETSVDCRMRRIMRRGSLQVHTDQYGSCTNSGFTILGSLSPQHPIDMHLGLVETRHRASSRPGCAQISIDCRIRRSMRRGSLQVHTSQFGSCTNSGFTFVSSVVPWFLLLCKLHLWKHGTGREEAPNARKFQLTAVYDAACGGVVCRPVQVSTVLRPKEGL